MAPRASRRMPKNSATLRWPMWTTVSVFEGPGKEKVAQLRK